MKKILYLLIALAFIACDSSDQGVAEKSVKKYLSENLDDATSYSPVSFELLDSATIEDCYIYRSYLESVSDMENRVQDMSRRISDLQERKLSGSDLYKDFQRDLLSYQIGLEKAIKNLDNAKSNLCSDNKYSIYHTYRAKNKTGGAELYTSKFILDKDFEVLEEID